MLSTTNFTAASATAWAAAGSFSIAATRSPWNLPPDALTSIGMIFTPLAFAVLTRASVGEARPGVQALELIDRPSSDSCSQEA